MAIVFWVILLEFYC